MYLDAVLLGWTVSKGSQVVLLAFCMVADPSGPLGLLKPPLKFSVPYICMGYSS